MALILADYRRQYPQTVAVQNGHDWREVHIGRAHFAAAKGPLVMWFEDDRAVYGFKPAEEAAQFKAWVDGCGIDWTKDPRAGPIPDFVKPPDRPSIDPTYRGHSGGPSPKGRGSTDKS